MSRQSVTIAGGGWAGLACAVELSRHDIDVTLYESAKQPGGRARRVTLNGIPFDNGQHLLIGAYRETLRLLDIIGEGEKGVLRLPLRLDVSHGSERLTLKAPPLPAPLHLIAALLTAGGLPLSERLAAIRFAVAMKLKGFTLADDCSVAELLQHHRQSERLIRDLWEPLCIATLNTPIAKASARAFLVVLRDSFSRWRSDSDLLLPATDLGALLPEPACDYLSRHRAKVAFRHRLEEITLEGNSLSAIRVNGEERPCRQLVLATPAQITARLFAGHPPLDPLADRLKQLNYQPIATLYLRYPEPTRLPQPMIGLSGTVSQWVIDRFHCGQPGWMAVVISAEGAHEAMDREALTAKVTAELAAHLPHWPAPLESRLIREKRATIACTPTTEALRPANTTPVDGLWLAGDYTATGYPATLEGAVLSGVKCARAIVAKLHNN